MPSLFSRKTDASAPAGLTSEPAEDAIVHRSRSYTEKKGKVTPKRTEAQRRKAEPPPANRREAMKRAREKQRAERQEQMAGMRAGDERYLLPRDKGPERATVRDLVDSRRNAGTWFFGGMFVILFAMQIQDPRVLLAANLIWVALAAMMIVDSIILSRKVKRIIGERFPKTTQKMRGLYFYAIMRAVTFRRMRMPKARVKIGEAY